MFLNNSWIFAISFQKLIFFESNCQSEGILSRIFNQKIKSPINNQRVCTIYGRVVVVIKRKKKKKRNRKLFKSENSYWTFALATANLCTQQAISPVHRPGDAIPEQRTSEGLALQRAGGEKLLIKPLPFNVSLFPTVFFSSVF